MEVVRQVCISGPVEEVSPVCGDNCES